jgi:hypothetical protein
MQRTQQAPKYIPEYVQSITLYYEGKIEKAGVLLMSTKDQPVRPVLAFASDFASETYPYLGAVIQGDAAVVKDTQRFIEWAEAEWKKSGKKNAGINIAMDEDPKRQLANQDAMPKFGSYLNVPITLQCGKSEEQYEDIDAFLSMSFPSQEMLAMGGGQPKVIITRVAEPESRIDEILDEMAMWLTKRLGANYLTGRAAGA